MEPNFWDENPYNDNPYEPDGNHNSYGVTYQMTNGSIGPVNDGAIVGQPPVTPTKPKTGPGGMPALPSNPYDRDAIKQAIIAARVAQGGTAESVTDQDINYWTTQILANGGLTQYWSDKLLHGNEGGNGGGGGGEDFGTYHSDPWTGGAPPSYSSKPWEGGPAPTFTAPTGLTEENDPGYQARLAAGQLGLQRGASAKGSLLSGGTIKAATQYGQEFASNEFGNVYNRALQDFSAKNQTYNNQYQAYLGDNARNFQDYQASKSNYQDLYSQYLNNNARTLSDYLTNYNVKHTSIEDWARHNEFTQNLGFQGAAGGA